MHTMIAYFIRTADSQTIGPEFSEIHNAVKQAISPDPSASNHCSVLPFVYVVRLQAEGDRERILGRLEMVGRTYPNQLEYVVTPVIKGGAYDGFLPGEKWETLNDLSKEEQATRKGLLATLGAATAAATALSAGLASAKGFPVHVSESTRRSIEGGDK